MAGYGSGLYGGGLYGTGGGSTPLHAPALRQLFPVKDGVLGGVYLSDVTIEGAHLDDAYYNAQYELTDLFPDTSTLLLGDWERIFGLTATGSVADRQAAVVAKWRIVVNKSGRLTVNYLTNYMANYGGTNAHPEAYIVEGITLMFVVAHSPNESVLPHAVYNIEENWVAEFHISLPAPQRALFEANIKAIIPAFVLPEFQYF